MQRILVLASALVLFSFASTSHAYPWMIRHGFDKCASCHTDPMGGETLTSFGRVESQTTLSTRWGQKEPTSAAELLFGIPEPQALRVGGSFRFMDALYKFQNGSQKSTFDYFPMQLDAYGQLTLFRRLKIGGSIGVTRATGGRSEGRAAQITKGNADGDWNLLSRSHWLGFDITDDLMIRAGRLNLPFGIRMPEHTMWVRSATHTDRESQQQDGLAIDYSAGRWRGELMGIAGNYQISPDKFRERGYSLYVEYLLAKKAAIGVSSLVTHTKFDPAVSAPRTRMAHGLTGRWSPVLPLVVLAEADLLASDQSNPGYVGMLQADLEFVQGLHVMLTGETRNEGRLSNQQAITGIGKNQLGGWATLAWFFYTHLDARVDLVVHQNEQAELLSQIHWYF